jgi:hypothetical protein
MMKIHSFYPPGSWFGVFPSRASSTAGRRFIAQLSTFKFDQTSIDGDNRRHYLPSMRKFNIHLCFLGVFTINSFMDLKIFVDN